MYLWCTLLRIGTSTSPLRARACIIILRACVWWSFRHLLCPSFPATYVPVSDNEWFGPISSTHTHKRERENATALLMLLLMVITSKSHRLYEGGVYAVGIPSSIRFPRYVVAQLPSCAAICRHHNDSRASLNRPTHILSP